MAAPDWHFILSLTLRLFLNFLAFSGIALVAYEIVASQLHSRWTALDHLASFSSALLTLCGTILTIITGVYLSSTTPTPPELQTVYVTAPLFLLSSLIAIILLLWRGALPAHVVNGFALTTIAAALLRFQPNPIHDPRLFWIF